MKGYSIRKLYGKARAAVLEKYRHIEVEDTEWWDSEYDWWKDQLDEEGFRDVEIQFSGFWCQGDGASFTAPSIDLMKFLRFGTRWKPEYRLLEVVQSLDFYLDAKVIRTGSHYVHEYTVDPDIQTNVDCDGLLLQRINSIIDEVAELLKVRVIELCQTIYKSLEAEYDGLVTDDAVMEGLEARDYVFNYKGEKL